MSLADASAENRPVLDRKALAVVVFGAVVIGLAPILVRLSETGPAAAGFWRFAFALPLLLVLSIRPGGEGVRGPTRWMLLAGLLLATDLSFWHYGIQMTSVANATVICNLAPVVVTLFSWIVLKQKPRRLFLLALAIAIAGAWAMAAGASGEQGTNPLLGDLFSLSVAFWYAGYFLAVSRSRKDASTGQVMLWSTALAVPATLGVALILREDMTPETVGGWAALVGLGVMHVVGQGAVAWALGRLPASVTSVVVLIQPVVAALLGWWLFHEAMTGPQMFGGVLVLAGVVLAQRAASRT